MDPKMIEALIDDYYAGGHSGFGSGNTSLAGYLNLRGIDWNVAVDIETSRDREAADRETEYWTGRTLVGDNPWLTRMLKALRDLDPAEYPEFDVYRDPKNYMNRLGAPLGHLSAELDARRIKLARARAARAARAAA